MVEVALDPVSGASDADQVIGAVFLGEHGAGIMGFLHYGQSDCAIAIDDRSLAHLKVVILTLLLDGQSVAFTFTHPLSEGAGRETIWITPTTELRFQFFGSRAPQLNHVWVEEMLRTATAPTGLHVTDEPGEVARPVTIRLADAPRLASATG